MKGQQVQVLQPTQKKYRYESAIWALCPAVFLTAGGMLAWMQLWGTMQPQYLLPGITALTGILMGWLGDRLGKKYRVFHFLWLVPWFFVLTYAVAYDGGTGFLAWINVLITRWNEVKEAGVQTFQISAHPENIIAISLVFALAQGELAWFLSRDRKMFGTDIYCLFWIFLMLQEQDLSAWSAAFLLAAVLSVRMSEKDMQISRPGKFWMLFLAICLGITAYVIPGETSGQMQEFRYQTVQGIRHLRYGKDVLPEGDLNLAGKLLENKDEVLKIQSGQEKNLYLRGFVGAVMKEGHWKELPDSAYGGENAGMLEWLAEQNFDPLMQVSRYYQIGNSEELPEENWLTVQTTGASRAYVYAPATLESITEGKRKELRDLRLRSAGITGERHYVMQERSGSRPSELMIADNWVYQPVTEEQRQYKDAEAVYRKFVYEQYTTVDEGLDELMQEWFWSDYDSENDGIYSALTNIRDRLAADITYVEHPKRAPEGEKALEWFLTESKEGNAVLYASAAVEAFRAHGIPARYVEGYYASSSSFAASPDGTISLTGQNAHAWVEVYFDGVGWLPVDVTPGYYYSIMELQQMVGSPDAVHKTAAVEDSIFGADEITNLGDGGNSQLPQPVKVMWNMLLVQLGVIAVLLVLLTILFVIAELGRVIWILRDKKFYKNASWEERIKEIEENIYLSLEILGIHATLGWRTEEVDEAITQIAGSVDPGDYTRVCRLLEKAVYGGMKLEPYDERVIIAFRGKLYQAGMSADWLTRLKFHYFGWYRSYFVHLSFKKG